ncbi:MAG: polymerase subunit delta [Verrucomicrobiota bacterium]|jgi:DNA polymerase-3 subunit delta'
MSFAALAEQQGAVRLLQRGLETGRLAHAYLFNGSDIDELETVARTLAKTLCCEKPPRLGTGGMPLDCCDACTSCRKIEEETHPDVLVIRPEMKSRQIGIGQIVQREDSPPRPLLAAVYVKPTQARYKIGMIVSADRMTIQAGNSFLKSLEEPPADTVFILLTTDIERLIETILSRCQRINFSGESQRHRQPAMIEWLREFSAAAAQPQKSLLGRYRLLSVLLAKLTAARESIEEALTKRSALERYDDIDSGLKKKWEDELSASVEAEYRRYRGDLLAGLQWWMRDVWLQALELTDGLLSYPELAAESHAVATRVSARQATENLQLLEETQRLLTSNVQESLALEVGLLKLRL